MKTLWSEVLSFALLFSVATIACLQAQAQDCPWAKVTSLTGTYTLTGNGSGPDVHGSYTWTISHQASGTANMSTGSDTGCGPFTFRGLDTITTGSVQDIGTAPLCPPPDNGINQLVSVGAAPGGPSGGTLVIDPAAGTYTYYEEVAAGGTTTVTTCGIPTVTSDILQVWPLGGQLCETFYTQPFPLPLSVGPLTQTDVTFITGAECPFLVPTTWSFSFNLTPTINDNQDDPCSKTGGSSIACQNQSLAEDVPIVGTGFFLHYESARAPGTNGAYGVATTDSHSLGGWTLSMHHVLDVGSGTLFLGGGTQRSSWQMGSPVTLNGNILLTSENGDEIYVFSPIGQHLQTLKPMTGALKYQFGYDTAGNLSTITDGSGNITTIQRDAAEHPIAIVSPFSQTTSLGLDGNGFLSQVTDPALNTVKFKNTSSGLLIARSDANGNVYSYNYDGTGKLILDSDPAGGSTTLSRTDSSSGYSVTTTTAVGRTGTFQVTTGVLGEEFTNTWPNGLQATMTNLQQNGQLSENMTLPDGTTNSATLGPDPRWGLQVPVPLSSMQTLGNLTMTTSGSRTATLGTQGNPFSLTTQTDTATVNGRTYKSVFTSSNKTYVDTSPAKRTTTTLLDSLERLGSVQVGALLPVAFAYDSHGRLSTITQGTRTSTLTYDANGFMATTTDPMKLTTNFTRDADGRLLTTTLPDGRVISYTYDANGNVTSITPPGKSAHDFSYTAVDLTSAYTPPTVSGTGATTYAFNANRDITTVTRPDGQIIAFGYDSAGRLSSTTTPTETTSYGYDSTTGNLSSASIAGGEAIAYGYNGPLPTSSTWTGSVAGNVSRIYNNNFWVTSESINSGNTINFSYDNDGLITHAGALTLKLDPKDGLIKSTTLGSATDTRTFSTFGELTAYTAKYGTIILDLVHFTREADGRIITETETIGGKKNIFAYSYDAAGRLTGVKKNGVSFSSYVYDSNSNRVTATTSSGTVTGAYDAQDRLLSYGGASYTYTANGELSSQTVGSQTTTYAYDVSGNLTGASLPNGAKISYILDPEDHRVGKQVNGTLVTGFIYDNDKIIAQLDGGNNIVSQFIFGTNPDVPDYMLSGGVTYRIFSDQLGSPRLVVNTSTGAVVEQIDYDEFGNIINDTNPGFQPFGFAGGLYDQDTKFVRFGARDYNPSIGRWTAKDPSLFNGEDTDLYGYVFSDPVNLADPSGLGPNCKKWKHRAKKAADTIAHKVTGDKIGIHEGPVSVGVSIDKPEISATASVSVEVEGVKVAEATGQAAVGIKAPETPGDPPKGDLFYVDLTGKVVLLGHEFQIFHYHGEGGDPNKGQVTHNILSHKPGADQALCGENDSCQ
jgi:RHS repeat-associated protein